MSDHGVWPGDMPSLPFRRRPSDPPEAEQLDALLDGSMGASENPDWRGVANVLQAAAGPATASEVADSRELESIVLAAFRAAQHDVFAAAADRPLVKRRVTTPGLGPLRRLRTTGSRIAAAVSCAVLGVGGIATAAYANALPGPVQSFAHDVIGAPVPHPARGGSPAPDAAGVATPSAAGISSPSASADHAASRTPSSSASASSLPSTSSAQNAASGLCRAYAETRAHGATAEPQLVAQLAGLAGGSAQIDTFCAGVAASTGDEPGASHGQQNSHQPGSDQHGDSSHGSDQHGSDQHGSGSQGNDQHGNNQPGNGQPGNGQPGNDQQGNDNGLGDGLSDGLGHAIRDGQHTGPLGG